MWLRSLDNLKKKCGNFTFSDEQFAAGAVIINFYPFVCFHLREKENREPKDDIVYVIFQSLTF